MSTAADTDADFIAQALPAFVSEAQEQIAAIEELLLELEEAPDNRELLDALFRCAHTIKGSAGIFGLDGVVAFTHHVETLLDQLREGALAFDAELSTLLLQANDQVRALIAMALESRSESAQAASAREALVVRLQSAGPASAAHGAVAHTMSTAAPETPSNSGEWHLRVKFGIEIFRNGMDPLAILNYLRKLGTISELVCDTAAVPAIDAINAEDCHLAFTFKLTTQSSQEAIESAFSFVRDDCELHIEQVVKVAVATAAAALVETPRAAIASAAPVASASVATASDDNRFIRVQANRLDEVINLLGELVTAGAGAALLARQSRNGTLIEANQHINRLIEDIRNGTLQLRMVPIGETFSRFRRVVRDTASELGKDVALSIVGGDTELDKSVVERIADPLMHLVRNALDHGLETPEQRVATGKPAQAKLTLSARHESGNILINISDDGRGIDRVKVLQRAHERGLVDPSVTPQDEDILKLIFEPGFSTAEKVTNLSGRGVGMDVVRRNIEALRGSVTVYSVMGEGSRIEIRLPLTLAIIDGFLIGIGASRFIFPLDAVVEVIETRPDLLTIDSQGRCLVELRGTLLPVVDLRRLYGLSDAAPQRMSVVVIKSGTRSFGVMVDQLLGQHQTVIKPLGRMFRSLRGMSGSSILGNGEVALIFDVNSLCDLAAGAHSKVNASAPAAATPFLQPALSA